MRKEDIYPKVFIITLAISALICIWGYGRKSERNSVESQKETAKEPVKEMKLGRAESLRKIQFDGHTWVIYKFTEHYKAGGGMVHHPDCPCNKNTNTP